MNLPPLPFLPASPEQRIHLIAWGEECARMGAEAERLSFYSAQVSGEPATVRDGQKRKRKKNSLPKNNGNGARFAFCGDTHFFLYPNDDEEVRDDAERYRWLLESDARLAVSATHRQAMRHAWDLLYDEDDIGRIKSEIDAAIDAARSAE
jgi:hypothetical protein